jgi:hypothetical protein
MTRDEYLDQFHELTNKVLPEIATRLARGDSDEAADLLTKLRAKQSDMWTSYMAQASAAVNP